VADRAALEGLLRELKLASSPIGRVKLLGRAWRTLRALDPAQLRELAREAGLERAEGLLRRLAKDEGRLTPRLLLRVLRRARDVDAGQVDTVVRAIRDPERRNELLRDGLDAVEGWLDGGGVAGQAPALEAEPAPAATAEPVSAPAVAPPEIPAAKPTELPAEATPREPHETVARPAKPPPAAAVEVVRTHRPTPAPYVPERDGAEVTPPPPSERTEEVEDVIAEIAGAPTTIQRLGTLREELDALADADVEELERVLDLFPDGWARRRALAFLLRAGVPRELMHAVFLIERLGSPAARRWCAGVLLDSRPLAEHERTALAERHGVFRHRRPAAV
jgi:hypothetical protein